MFVRNSIILASAALFAATLGVTGASAGVSFGPSPVNAQIQSAEIVDVKFGTRSFRGHRGGFRSGFRGGFKRDFKKGHSRGFFKRGHKLHGFKSHGKRKFFFPGVGVVIKK